MIIDIADMDVVYLSFDEPKKDEFWLKIKNMVPWAKRVDNVKGSDTAHKEAAKISSTERFILIDGDNIPHAEFFSKQLVLNENNKNNVFRWKAVNVVNGLMYGNGGISCWTKDFVQSMKTHENSDGLNINNVEFCYDPLYTAMHNVYSTTYPNQSEKHAWRAGFREGVKLCLDKGVKPSLEEFENKVHNKNLDKLLIWMNIGTDSENGIYSIAGARIGVHKLFFTDWDYNEVQDFNCLDKLWKEYQDRSSEYMNDSTRVLMNRLGFPIVDYTPEQSKFFKYFYKKQHKQMDIMCTELDTIRLNEGW